MYTETVYTKKGKGPYYTASADYYVDKDNHNTQLGLWGAPTGHKTIISPYFTTPEMAINFVKRMISREKNRKYCK